MSNYYCKVCDVESALSYKCSRCGKPADGDSDSTGSQALRPDGGTEIDPEDLSTHELVIWALEELNDYERDGVPKPEIVDWVLDRADLERADVHEAIRSWHQNGWVYDPRATDGDHLKRTQRNGGVRA